MQAAAHVGDAGPAHAGVQDVAVQLRVDQLLHSKLQTINDQMSEVSMAEQA